MEDWKKADSYSMSFDLKADEEAVEFFNKTMKELQDSEEALKSRIKQLFDEFISIGGEKREEGYKEILNVFALGYGLGWNDRKKVDEKWSTKGKR